MGPAVTRTKPLKVAYILHRFPHLTETFIVREIYWLRRRGVEVTILSVLKPWSGNITSAQAASLLPHVEYGPRLSPRVLRSQLAMLRRDPGAYFRSLGALIWKSYREPQVMLLCLSLFPKAVDYARRLQELEVDHVHAHFAWIEGLVAGVVRDLTGITYSITPHAFDLFSRDRESVRRELESATGVVTISEHNREYIARSCPGMDAGAIPVVRCGLELDSYAPAERRRAAGPVRIVSVGRFIEKKGHEHLVEACGHLARRGVDFECLILGGGPQRARAALDAQIDRLGLRGRVQLREAAPPEEVTELYRDSDIFALACVIARDGDRDGIPVVLMEAMACALPVVSTTVSGIPELVSHERNGLLVPPRDPAALADALERLIQDPSLRRRLGREGRRTVVEEYDIRRSAAQVEAAFREILRRAPREPRTVPVASRRVTSGRPS